MKRRQLIKALFAVSLFPLIAYGQQPLVIMFATSWCPYCAQARQFFLDNGISVHEYDIEKDSYAYEQYKKAGGKGVPLIIVGSTIVYGFNEPQLRRLLGI